MPSQSGAENSPRQDGLWARHRDWTRAARRLDDAQENMQDGVHRRRVDVGNPPWSTGQPVVVAAAPSRLIVLAHAGPATTAQFLRTVAIHTSHASALWTFGATMLFRACCPYLGAIVNLSQESLDAVAIQRSSDAPTSQSYLGPPIRSKDASHIRGSPSCQADIHQACFNRLCFFW